MKVGILGNPNGDRGIDNYARNLCRELNGKGIDFSTIWIDEPRAPIEKVIHRLTLYPSEVIKKAENYDIIHAVQPDLTAAFPLIEKPKVVTFHDLIPTLDNTYRQKRKFRLRSLSFLPFKIWTFTSRFADRYIAVSNQTKRDLTKLNFSSDSIRTINHGVEEKFKNLNNIKRDVFGYLGPLTLRKGVDFVIKSIYHLKKKIPGIKLLVYGKVNEKWEYEELVSLVKKLNLEENVFFKGFIPEEQKVKAYNKFIAYLFGTHVEGFGLTILESLKCGTPVIVRDAKIPKETKENCITVETPKEMAEKAYELYTNKEHREKIAHSNIQYAKKFSWEKTVEKTISVYEEIC